ncbi:MAG: hypothetical protein AAGB04_11310, partial [Pseudomonadota bacterium]
MAPKIPIAVQLSPLEAVNAGRQRLPVPYYNSLTKQQVLGQLLRLEQGNGGGRLLIGGGRAQENT